MLWFDDELGYTATIFKSLATVDKLWFDDELG